MRSVPTAEQLTRVAQFAEAFDEPGFSAGEWIQPQPLEGGAIQLGWWNTSAIVVLWSEALYDNDIIDSGSDYLAPETTNLLQELMEEPAGAVNLSLSQLRTVLTFLARAERHTGGGWFEQAFESGFAQAATRRLGQLADIGGDPSH